MAAPSKNENGPTPRGVLDALWAGLWCSIAVGALLRLCLTLAG